MRIGINAHLLSRQSGYRSAGIHGFIYNTLANIGRYKPEDWEFTAMVGSACPHFFDDVVVRKSKMDTERPAQRILWEQTRQPFQMGDFDLVHAMAFVSPVLSRKPSVVTVYDLSFVHYPQVLSRSRRMYLRTFTARSCRRARRVIAISHSTARDVHKTFGVPMDRIDVVPGGYNRRRYYPIPQAEQSKFKVKKGLPSRYWMFLGTLEPRKNLITLIDAYAQLKPDERLPLVIAGGKGWDYDAIFERVERYKLTESVHFPGFIPIDELALWYNSAEVFIYPSVYEGFGLPVLEAMACGTPIVIADASSLPEVGGDAALKVPPLDVDAWVDALKRAFQDADWRIKASQRGIELAQAYSWRETARLTMGSYQRALGTT